MHVLVTGGTGHAGSYIIPELIAAGHQVTGLARSDASAATLSAQGATVRRGSLEDLDGLKEAAANADGVIHVAHRQDLLPSGGMDAVAAAAVSDRARPVTSCPAAMSSGMMYEPAWPVPPVTKTRM